MIQEIYSSVCSDRWSDLKCEDGRETPAGNWLLSTALTAPAPPWSVAYTTFLEQLEAGNVVEITATGQRIQGRSEQPVAVTVADAPREVVRFETERPLFADDHLLGALREQDVVVRAEPTSRRHRGSNCYSGSVPPCPTLRAVAAADHLRRRCESTTPSRNSLRSSTSCATLTATRDRWHDPAVDGPERPAGVRGHPSAARPRDPRRGDRLRHRGSPAP